ncbi:MOSC domain-containing protein [Jonesiaceae bacterium BS-20]|uniref:MOSC domain-containing protein n=1 Tax=Jonesiaceae bacterium BS-20 TaxID=3120821 RepID=A0AAU7DXA3_9MICO
MDASPSPAGSLLAICRVHQLLPSVTTWGITAIDKRSVAEPVNVRKLGLFGDVQVDREHHGGYDQAVYAYSQEDADYWGAELGRPITPGLFGENLRTRGIATTDAVIGTRWQIGTAILEVTSPRNPCATFAERMGEPQWVKRFTRAGRVGCYLRVIQTGKAQAGDSIVEEYVPDHGITVGMVFAGLSLAEAKALLAAQESGGLDLAENVMKEIRRTFKRSGLVA